MHVIDEKVKFKKMKNDGWYEMCEVWYLILSQWSMRKWRMMVEMIDIAINLRNTSVPHLRRSWSYCFNMFEQLKRKYVSHTVLGKRQQPYHQYNRWGSEDWWSIWSMWLMIDEENLIRMMIDEEYQRSMTWPWWWRREDDRWMMSERREQ